ncbi:MAG: tetratricopeptide repeat protein [Pyrinomonadaceae bacterium]
MKFAYVRIISLVLSTVLVSLVSLYGQTPEQLKRASEHFKQGNEHYRNDRYDAAIASFSEYLKIQPRGETAWYNRGLAYRLKAELAMSRLDFDRAEADFSQAIKVNPKNADYWSERGVVRIRLAEIDTAKRPQAITDFTEAIKLNPRLSQAYSGRGQMYEAQRDNAKAMADVNEAIRLNPKDFVALFTRGKLFSVSKKYTAARADLEKAIKLYPNYDLAKSHLSYVNSELAKANPTKVAVGGTTPPVATIAITDPYDGRILAENALKAGNYLSAIDLATWSLVLIKLDAEGTPSKDLLTNVYFDLLITRARSYEALRRFTESDRDRGTIAMAGMKGMNRYLDAADVELQKDKIMQGTGFLFAQTQTITATSICDQSLGSTMEWADLVIKNRPNDEIRRGAGAALYGVKEICSTTYIIHAMYQSGSTMLSSVNASKARIDAVASLTTAISLSPKNRKAYQDRAKLYRALGKADLAAADEQKVRELPPSK